MDYLIKTDDLIKLEKSYRRRGEELINKANKYKILLLAQDAERLMREANKSIPKKQKQK